MWCFLAGLALLAWCSVPLLRAAFEGISTAYRLSDRGRLDVAEEMASDVWVRPPDIVLYEQKFHYQLCVRDRVPLPKNFFKPPRTKASAQKQLRTAAGWLRLARRLLLWPLRWSEDTRDILATRLAVDDYISRHAYGVPTCLCSDRQCDGWACLPEGIAERLHISAVPTDDE